MDLGTEEKNKIFIATFLRVNKNLLKLVNTDLHSKLDLNQESRLGLLTQQQKASYTLNANRNDKHFKLIPPEHIHITWKFIGDIEVKNNEKIFVTLRESAFILKDCALNFDKLEAWPNSRTPRVLCLTSRSFDEKFKEFFDNLEESLFKNLAIQKEKREFIPHVTVARIKQNKKIKVSDINFEPVKLDIKSICVVQSINTPEGISYKTLFEQEL